MANSTQPTLSATEEFVNKLRSAVDDYLYHSAVSGIFISLFVATTIVLEVFPVLRAYTGVRWFHRTLLATAVAHLFIIYTTVPDLNDNVRLTFVILFWILTAMAALYMLKTSTLIIYRLILYRSFSLAFGPTTAIVVQGKVVAIHCLPSYLALQKHDRDLNIIPACTVIKCDKPLDELNCYGLSGFQTKVKYEFIKGSGLTDNDSAMATYKGSETTATELLIPLSERNGLFF